MPKGPKSVRRPADTNSAAVMVGRIATGEIEDKPSKAPGRAAGGKAGGQARALCHHRHIRVELGCLRGDLSLAAL